MGVEVAETVKESTVTLNDGKPAIIFGSHGEEAEPSKVEKIAVSDSHLPKDAVDEWPEPKQIHSFYIVRLRSLEDQNLKAKIELAEKELQKKNQARSQVIEKLKAKRAERSQLVVQLKSLGSEYKQFKSVIDEKRKEMEPLQQALGKLRSGSSVGGGRDRGSLAICSSEEELNGVIRSLQYRIQHESIPLSEEKQILREIKQLEGTRERILANAAERAKIQESLGEKDAIQGQVKSIGVDLDGVRKEKNVISSKIKQLDEEKVAVEKQINALEEELTSISEKRDSTFESIKEMRKQRDEGNSTFYQYRTIVTKAKVLAANKDIDALKELLHTEVGNFMSLWNTNKEFRDDYEKRVLPSLDSRQLTRDGRMRNPNEKPLFRQEKPVTDPSESEVVIKGGKKQIPEEVNTASNAQKPKADASTDRSKKEPVEKASKKIEPIKEEDEEGFYVDTTRKDFHPKKEDEVDEKKLIEIKKEEEIVKRKQAEERKRKLAEKAAAKAAVRAQKEAEKKLKEREKRTRKKAGATEVPNEEVDEVPTAEETEEIAEVEPEKRDVEKVEVSRKRDKKEGCGVKRRARPRGNESLPKAILKRKKGTNYWAWGGGIALALLLVLMVLGYGYYYEN